MPALPAPTSTGLQDVIAADAAGVMKSDFGVDAVFYTGDAAGVACTVTVSPAASEPRQRRTPGYGAEHVGKVHMLSVARSAIAVVQVGDRFVVHGRWVGREEAEVTLRVKSVKLVENADWLLEVA